MTKTTILLRMLLAAGATLLASTALAWGNPHGGGAGAPPRVGVLVYGAGMMDGSEVQEVVLTMLALDRAGAQVVFIAPAGAQAEVVNHQTGAVVAGERREMLAEAARITHGGVVPLDRVEPEDLDALIVPGGLGFVKSVTTFGKDGMGMTYDAALGRLLGELHAARKPIAFLCITPVLAAKLFGAERPRLTLGTDPGMAAVLESAGAQAVSATADEVVVDERARLVSSPAYMVGPSVAPVARGIEKAVERTLDLVQRRHH
jgi:enhancing lycopene biosynthesis protein 2